MRHVQMLSESYIHVLQRRLKRRDLRQNLKADVQAGMQIARESTFHSGQIRTKNNSRNVDVQAGLRNRSRPEEPCHVLEWLNSTV